MQGVVFSPDGKTIVTANNDGIARLWDVETGRELRRWTGPARMGGGAVTFTPDDRRALYAIGGEHGFHVVDVETGKELGHFEGHTHNVYALAVSPNGRYVASAGNDKVVRLWAAEEGRSVRELAGHAEHVYSLAFHPESGHLVSGDLKGTLKQWDVGRELRKRIRKAFEANGIEIPFPERVVTVRGRGPEADDRESAGA